MFQCLHQLRQLNISSCMAVDDKVLKILAENCPTLQLLKVGKCYNLTDKGIESLALNLPGLSALDISHTKVIQFYTVSKEKNCCRKDSIKKFSIGHKRWYHVLIAEYLCAYNYRIEHRRMPTVNCCVRRDI